MFSKNKKFFQTFLFYLVPKNWPVILRLTAIDDLGGFVRRYTRLLIYIIFSATERKSSGNPSSFSISTSVHG